MKSMEGNAMKKVLLGVAALFWMLSASAEAPLPGPDDVTIEVRSGDTLGDLARTQMDMPSRWRDVANYNLLPDPTRTGSSPASNCASSASG
jgi:hypothetical protein